MIVVMMIMIVVMMMVVTMMDDYVSVIGSDCDASDYDNGHYISDDGGSNDDSHDDSVGDRDGGAGDYNGSGDGDISGDEDVNDNGSIQVLVIVINYNSDYGGDHDVGDYRDDNIGSDIWW